MSPRQECFAADGLPARATGPWVHQKLRPIERYVGIVTTAIKDKFPAGVVFIDLMAGPGRCVDVRSPGRPECDGSTLIALAARFPFSRVVAIDSNSTYTTALEQRAGHHSNLQVVNANCNHPATIALVRAATEHALSLMFVDLLGTEVEFETIRQITLGRSTDLVVTWPEMDLQRNRAMAMDNPERLDAFFGTNAWQTLAREIGPARRLKAFQGLYIQQLESIGYTHHAFMGGIRNRRRGVLYRLFFASRHDLGLAFWTTASNDANAPRLFE